MKNLWKLSRQHADLLKVIDKQQERLRSGTPLDLVNPLHCGQVERISAQAVEGIRRKGDDAAGLNGLACRSQLRFFKPLKVHADDLGGDVHDKDPLRLPDTVGTAGSCESQFGGIIAQSNGFLNASVPTTSHCFFLNQTLSLPADSTYLVEIESNVLSFKRHRYAHSIRQEQMNLNKSRFAAFLTFLLLSFVSSTALLRGQLNPFTLPQATLTVAISASDTAFTLDNAAGFPPSGAVAIDTEVIGYSSITSNTVTVLARAVASTTAASHAAGALVRFFPVHAGLLTASIDAAATTLNINSTATFPAGSGSILIDQEILTYGGGTTTTLTTLTRGQQGTTAAAHNAGALIIGRAATPTTQTFTIPRLISTSDNFSGIALANLSDGPASVTLNPISSSGAPLTVTDQSNTTVSIANSFALGARQQFVGGIADMFPNLNGATDFYVLLTTGNPFAVGVVDIGTVDPNSGLIRLDLAPISVLPSNDVILPIALQNSQQYGAGAFMEAGIVAGPVPTDIIADFVDANGNVVQETTLSAPAANQRYVQSLTDLFSNLAGQTVDSGYIHLSSSAGFTAYEIVSVGKENGYLAAVSRGDAASALTLPFVISSGPYQTRLVIEDGTAAILGQAPVGVAISQITAYNADGSLLTGPGITNPVQVTYPASGQFSQFISNLFGLGSTQAFSGYLRVETMGGASVSGIIASALILNLDRNQLTAVPGQIVPKTSLTLTPALFDPQITTALSLVNPNTISTTAQIQITRGTGSIQESRTVTIPALGQTVAVLSALFPDISVESDGYISVTSSQPIFGMIVFDDGVFLASGYPINLPAQLVASPDPVGLATPNSATVPLSASSYPLTVQIPNPAPPGGLLITVQVLNPVIATLSSNFLIIPQGQSSGTVTVYGQISGGTVINVRAPGFLTTSVVVAVQNATDLTLSRNVTISPTTATVQSGGTFQFSLAFDTTNNPAVVWNVGGVQNGQNAVGTITQSGLYTAPLLLPTDQPVLTLVSVTNVNTTFFGATASVTVLPPPSQ